MFSAHLSRRMIVAKYVDSMILLQPVGQVCKMEKLTPYNRNMKKRSQKESASSFGSFGSLFQKALEKHATNDGYNESNGFDVLC